MTKKTYAPHDHSGGTGPLDPTVERAHLFAKWEEEELTTTIPQAHTPAADDWLFGETPEGESDKVGGQA